MKVALLAFGVLFILASPCLIIAHPAILAWAYPLLEEHLSHDNQIAPESEVRLAEATYYSFMIIALLGGLLLLAGLSDSFRKAAKPSLLPLLLGLLLTIPALPRVMSLGCPIPLRFLYEEDGPLESLTVLAFLASAFFFGMAAWSVWRILRDQNRGNYRWVFWLCIVFMLLTFVVAMEEISWGQRILGLKTPEPLAQINFQQETTLHNLVFHRSLTATYRALAILPIAAVIGVWLRASTPRERPYYCILPHTDIVGLTALIGFLVVVPIYAELIEELMSLLALVYSLGVARCLRREAAEGGVATKPDVNP